MSFIEDYFINPILNNGWFNPVNTLVYSIILVIAVYFVYKMLKRLNIHIDRYFLIAILPFIFWASSTRVLHDSAFAGVLNPVLNRFYSSPIFVTPGSYLITFLLALVTLLISLIVQNYAKISYWKIMLFFGVMLSTINICLLPIITFLPIVYISLVTGLWVILFFLIRKISGNLKCKCFSFLSYENIGLISVHMFDASATYVALSLFGYLEQHVLPRLAISILGPSAMFLLKIFVIIPVLYVIDSYSETPKKKGSKNQHSYSDFKNFLKIVILILGLAPALRDTIRLMALV